MQNVTKTRPALMSFSKSIVIGYWSSWLKWLSTLKYPDESVVYFVKSSCLCIYSVGLFLKPVMSPWPLHFTGQVANEIILVQNWAFIEPHQKQLSLLGAVWFRAGSGSSRCADGPLDHWTLGPVHYCLSNLLCLLLPQLKWTWTWSYPHRWCSLMCPFYLNRLGFYNEVMK